MGWILVLSFCHGLNYKCIEWSHIDCSPIMFIVVYISTCRCWFFTAIMRKSNTTDFILPIIHFMSPGTFLLYPGNVTFFSVCFSKHVSPLISVCNGFPVFLFPYGIVCQYILDRSISSFTSLMQMLNCISACRSLVLYLSICSNMLDMFCWKKYY